MPLDNEQIAFLRNLDRGHIHGKNMLAKKIKPEIERFYGPYRKFLSALNGDLEKSVKALNEYKDYVLQDNPFTSQSKFDPSIVEEFICQTLKAKFGNDVLMYGSVKAYSSLYFTYPSKEAFKQGVVLKINVKDQDVGIYKKEAIRTEDGTIHDIIIPMVCVECKTYLDKTMYEGSVATAIKIKNGNPRCLFYIVTETYDVSSSVDIDMTQIDNIYVLRKQRRRAGAGSTSINKISADVVKHLLQKIEVRLQAEKETVDELIKGKGYLRD